MEKYNEQIKTANISINKIKSEINKLGIICQIAQPGGYNSHKNTKSRRNNDKKPTWGTPSPTLFSRETSDFLLYADDTNIEYNDISEIVPKLQTYKETAERGNFIINWENVFILVMNKRKK